MHVQRRKRSSGGRWRRSTPCRVTAHWTTSCQHATGRCGPPSPTRQAAVLAATCREHTPRRHLRCPIAAWPALPADVHGRAPGSSSPATPCPPARQPPSLQLHAALCPQAAEQAKRAVKQAESAAERRAREAHRRQAEVRRAPRSGSCARWGAGSLNCCCCCCCCCCCHGCHTAGSDVFAGILLAHDAAAYWRLLAADPPPSRRRPRGGLQWS